MSFHDGDERRCVDFLWPCKVKMWLCISVHILFKEEKILIVKKLNVSWPIVTQMVVPIESHTWEWGESLGRGPVNLSEIETKWRSRGIRQKRRRRKNDSVTREMDGCLRHQVEECAFNYKVSGSISLVRGCLNVAKKIASVGVMTK